MTDKKADIVDLVNKLKQLDNAQLMYIAGAADLACAMHQQPAGGGSPQQKI